MNSETSSEFSSVIFAVQDLIVHGKIKFEEKSDMVLRQTYFYFDHVNLVLFYL